MAKHTIVAIYEIDSTGATGARVGEGSLVDSELVFVHPPLSERIADGCGPRRLRLGIRSDFDGIPFVAVADAIDEPVVIGTAEDVGPLVGLILDGTSGAPWDGLTGVHQVGTVEELVVLAVPRLQYYAEDDWNGGGVPYSSSFWCRFVKRLC